MLHDAPCAAHSPGSPHQSHLERVARALFGWEIRFLVSESARVYTARANLADGVVVAPSFKHTMSRSEAVVIGAGVSGLTCAVRLLEAGAA